MKKHLIAFITLIIMSLTACSNQTISETNKENNVENAKLKNNVTLLVTSDIHGSVGENLTLAYVYDKREELKKRGDYTLLIDDGDLFQGGLLSSVSKGEDLIDIANAAGYDIATFGNHEFDYGMDNFLKLSKKLNCSYISCNFNKNGKLVFEPYVIKEFDSVKFGFIGINTPDSLTTSTPKYFQDANGNFIYNFFQGNNGDDYINQIQKTVDEVREKGAKYVVVVGHVGNKTTTGPYTYVDIISKTRGIDVFLDGHSHDTDQVNMKNIDGQNVFRMGVGTKLNSLGLVTFTPADTIEHELISYVPPQVGDQVQIYKNIVNETVFQKNQAIGDAMSEVIGKTEYNLYINDPVAKKDDGSAVRIIRNVETNLGDLVADAYKFRTGADAAYTNGGGIRVDVNAGDITLKDIKNVQPFGNIVCLIEVTGQQILDAMEWGTRKVPEESGGFPQVSGITMEIDPSIPDPCKTDDNGLCIGIEGERRIKNLKINGEDVDPNAKYKLATLSYTALDHGDGYTAFDGCEVLEMGIAEDWTVVVDYIKDNLNGVIPDKYENPYGEGRIVVLDK